MAIAPDGSGNVYVTGTTLDATNSNLLTLKFDSGGLVVWATPYDGPGRGNDQASALAVDGEGNVVVTGTVYWSPEAGQDIVTIKYTSEGQQVWLARYDGPWGRGEFRRSDVAVACATDAAGHIHVTGYSDLDDFLREYVTIKYDASGQGLWTNRFSGPYGSEPTALAVSEAGHVCVTGGSALTEDGFDDQDYTTIKFSFDGQTLWINRYRPELVLGSGEALSIALDADGNTYVTGYGGTVKYGPGGELVWAHPFPGYAQFVAVNRCGRVAVTGRTHSRDSSLATVTYDEGGAELWRNVATFGFDDSWPFGLAFDGMGNPVVGANSKRVHDSGYLLTAANAVRYDGTGQVLSRRGIAEWWPLGVGVQAIASDLADSIYLAGVHRLDANRPGELVVIKIQDIPLRIERLPDVMLIKWTATTLDAVLESAGTLPYGVWATVTNSVTVVDGENRVTVPIGQGNRFYRIR